MGILVREKGQTIPGRQRYGTIVINSHLTNASHLLMPHYESILYVRASQKHRRGVWQGTEEHMGMAEG